MPKTRNQLNVNRPLADVLVVFIQEIALGWDYFIRRAQPTVAWMFPILPPTLDLPVLSVHSGGLWEAEAAPRL